MLIILALFSKLGNVIFEGDWTAGYWAKGVDIHLQFSIVDGLVTDHGVELVPLKERTLHAFDLGYEGLFDKGLEDLD